MDSSRSIEDNLDKFIKMTLILKGTDQELGSTSLAMIPLNSLPDDYQVVKNALQYTSTIPTLDLIVAGLKTRELELKVQKMSGSNLFVKTKVESSQSGRNNSVNRGNMNKKKWKGNYKSKETRKFFFFFFFCNRAGHIKKNYFERIKK